MPTPILVGDLDPRTPVMNARDIAATLPAAKILVLTNAQISGLSQIAFQTIMVGNARV